MAQMKNPAHPEAFGIFIGGKNLADSGQTYTYFLVRPIDGMYSIRRRTAYMTRPTAIVEWTDPSESFLHLLHELFSLIEARHIDWKSDNRVVVRNLIGSGFILQVSEHHSGSRARERLHDGPADAAAASCDNCSFTGKHRKGILPRSAAKREADSGRRNDRDGLTIQISGFVLPMR